MTMRISSSLALAKLSFLASWDWHLEGVGTKGNRLSQIINVRKLKCKNYDNGL